MTDIVNIALWGVVIGCIAGWLLKLADKWDVLEWLMLHAPNDLIYKLVSCEFCRTWWTSVALSVLLLSVACEWWVLFVPFVATGIGMRYAK